MMLLVIDITKGLQAQTAECLVVGEMAAQHLVVALNKTDLLPAADRPKAIKKAQRRLAGVFASTRFAGAPMVPVCARPGGGSGSSIAGGSGGGAAAGVEGSSSGGGGIAAPADRASAAGTGAAEGIQELQEKLLSMASARTPDASAPFLFAVDHCFAIKGQGTVLTGTVLQGGVRVNDAVELPVLKISRQVRLGGWKFVGRRMVAFLFLRALPSALQTSKSRLGIRSPFQPTRPQIQPSQNHPDQNPDPDPRSNPSRCSAAPRAQPSRVTAPRCWSRSWTQS